MSEGADAPKAETLTARADYAPSREQRLGAWVSDVAYGSPAWEAGLEVGMRVDEVNGKPLRDLIDWRWETDGARAELTVSVPGESEPYAAVIEREAGEDWGIEFEGVVFDGMRTCVNACQFCFMAMLPPGVRSTLLLRDDDWRLSFLQGNFVTLTNVSDEEADLIVERHLAPMNVSLHAVTPQVRRSLIGPHAQRGIEVLERLCAAGIEVHAQIVVCPGINDGAELERTLDWVERREAIRSLALVPMGYTRFSRRFSASFSDDPDAAAAVVRMVEPYQERSRRNCGRTRFQLSDEFYLAAAIEVPPASTYDGYPQFYDGIGMLRSFIDETEELRRKRPRDLGEVASALDRRGRTAAIVCGEAASGVMGGLLASWAEAAGRQRESLPLQVLPIRNDYYGGDVNVTGLIVACDLLAQLPGDLANTLVVLPEVMFNFDGMTLDGGSLGSVTRAVGERGGQVTCAETTPTGLLDALLGWVHDTSGPDTCD